MNYTNTKTLVKNALMALFAVTLTAGPSLALELAAVQAQWSPDGGATQIPIWGFVEIESPDTATTYSCPATPLTWNGGPVLKAAAGSLTINIKNCLAAETSVFIPGQTKTLSPVLSSGRLYSLDVMVSGNGGYLSYSWNNAKEGTYLLQSGTDIRTQVPMGLYGALVLSGSGYPAVAQEDVLVFSEIDPRLNNDPGGFGGARIDRGTSGVDEPGWNPQYFLINGQSYNPVNPPIGINVSEDVLLRFVNAGLDTAVPTLEGGLYMDVIAEDGNLYPYPLTQYGLELPAGKTMDAVVNAGSPGTYAIYDRSLHLTNGGMVTYLQAGIVAGAPIAVNDPDVSVPNAFTITEGASLTAIAGGTPAGVLDNDTGGAAEAVLINGPTAGTLTGGLATNGSFTYTPNDSNFNGTDSFTYVANDGNSGPDSNVATATITVTPVNDAPTAAADSYSTPAGSMLSVAAPGVLANDVDVDMDNLTATAAGTTAGLTLNTDGSFDYTPTGAAGAIETFQYIADDGTADSNTVTVTITVTGAAGNIAPVAQSFTTTVKRNTTSTITLDATDSDGNIVWTSVSFAGGAITQRGGAVANNNDGTVNYTTPNPSFRGTDTFQYTVNDNGGLTSNMATVSINVVK